MWKQTMICNQISSASSMETYLIPMYMSKDIIPREYCGNSENVSIVEQCFFIFVTLLTKN
jgi:hypothetical protein